MAAPALHAALLEDFKPDVIVLDDVITAGQQAIEDRRASAMAKAASFERITHEHGRAIATNTVLQPAWDPRTEWEQATPGFPLEGGVEQWTAEVRGTCLDPLVRDPDA